MVCPPFGPLPSPYMAGPTQRPQEWLIIAGVTLLIILVLAVMRRRLMSKMPAQARRLVLALIAIGFAFQIATLGILIVGQMPWHDAMYAAYLPQIDHLAIVANHGVCYDALDHHFYLVQKSGDLVYDVSMCVMWIAGSGILIFAGRLQRKHEAVNLADMQPAEQGL